MAALEILLRSERAEAEGFYSLMNAVSDETKAELGIRTGRIAGAPVWACEAIDWTLFNRIIGLGLYEPCSEKALAEVSAFFTGTNHAIEVSPNATGLDADMLSARGYSEARRRPKLVRTCDPLPLPEGVEVRVAEPGDANDFAEVMAASFGFPDVAKVWMKSVVETPQPGRVTTLATVDGKPAGTGFVCCSDGVGWLGGGCCLPEFRGRGVQRALIEGRAGIARDLGAAWLTTETNADTAEAPGYSFRNMLRSGFEHVFDRPQYARTV